MCLVWSSTGTYLSTPYLFTSLTQFSHLSPLKPSFLPFFVLSSLVPLSFKHGNRGGLNTWRDCSPTQSLKSLHVPSRLPDTGPLPLHPSTFIPYHTSSVHPSTSRVPVFFFFDYVRLCFSSHHMSKCLMKKGLLQEILQINIIFRLYDLNVALTSPS